jgi:tetratricopeptide (TPR) repeat protein
VAPLCCAKRQGHIDKHARKVFTVRMRQPVRKKRTSGSRTIAPPTASPPRAYSGRAAASSACIFLAIIVLIVFGQTIRHEFVNYDDAEYVYENPRITAGLTLGGIQWAFTHVHSGNWHPLTSVSHMLDCQVYGLEPWGHHLTNVLLQAAAAILLFLALRELTGGPGRSGGVWPSAIVAALFAIHPLRVASVAWISERKDVLSGVFFMLVLWAYARYARSDRRHSFRWYITTILLFALGLMCKPTLVTVPFVLLLLDYWPLDRVRKSEIRSHKSAVSREGSRPRPASAWQAVVRGLVTEKIPFFVLSGASCVATILAQKQALVTMRQLTFAERAGNALISYVVYLGQMIYPAHLSAAYPYPEGHVNVAQVILAFLLLLIISVIFFLLRLRYPFLLVGWLWFLGMLIPMIGVVQVGPQAHADRYTYLPQIGLYILTIWGAMELFAKWRVRSEVAVGAALLMIGALMMASCFQTSYWRNSETLWRQALANTSNNYIAENGLGSALLQKKQLDEAAGHFRKALKIYPDYAEANNNLGYLLASEGNLADSISFYQTALQARPDYFKAYNNLGVSLAATGKTDEALANFREALRIDESCADAHCNLAHVLLDLGRRDEAVAHLTEALRLRPDYTDVREQLRQLGVEK